MSLGFTGSREGMVTVQWEAVERFMRDLFELRTGQWHDGDCKGADEMAHGLVETYNKFRTERDEDHILMYGHPCNISKWRAYREFDFTYPELPPLVRNRKIVHDSNAMIATPKEFDEIFKGSGTWATIRYATSTLTPLFIIYPNGEVEVRNCA